MYKSRDTKNFVTETVYLKDIKEGIPSYHIIVKRYTESLAYFDVSLKLKCLYEKHEMFFSFKMRTRVKVT